MSEAKTTLEPMECEIDGEKWDIRRVTPHGRGFRLECGGHVEFAVLPDAETAGEDARDYWRDMAENDPKEFAAIVGDETLIAWALGRSAGPGSTHVSSLEEWLDLTAGVPEEHHAGYDGAERSLDGCGEELAEELGFREGVAYRMH